MSPLGNERCKTNNEHVCRLYATEEMLEFNKIHVVMTSRPVVKKMYPTSRLLNWSSEPEYLSQEWNTFGGFSIPGENVIGMFILVAC